MGPTTGQIRPWPDRGPPPTMPPPDDDAVSSGVSVVGGSLVSVGTSVGAAVSPGELVAVGVLGVAVAVAAAVTLAFGTKTTCCSVISSAAWMWLGANEVIAVVATL